MCNRLISLIVAVLLLSVACTAFGQDDPALFGWWKLDEGQGNIANDSSAHGNDGTIFNLTGGMGPDGDAWVQDIERGMVLSFNGDNTNGTYVATTATIPAMSLTNDFTWMFWCKQDQAGTGVNDVILGNRYGGTASPLQFIKFTPTKFEYYNDDTAYTTSITYATPMPDGEWVHNVGVKKGNSLSYYRNGAKMGASTTITKTIDANPFLMGGNLQSDPGGERWRGWLSDVRLYERAWTDAEIKQVASRPKARKPDPADGALAVALPLLRWTKGDTAVFHNVYLGTTPELTEANRIATNSLMTMYYHMQGFEPGVTYYWRVDEIEPDMVTVHTGDVWTFTTQATTAYYPSPKDKAVDASTAPTLTWLPGQGASKHHVYFSDNLDAVTQGAAGADKGEVAEPTFAPGDLQSVTTYYWRVDEVLFSGELEAGPVWSFTTVLPVDDFESYTDDEGSRIYETWIDGWTNGTGSQVGNTQAPFAERTIIHGGAQSMPLDYNNVNSPFLSEAERTFAPVQDWTVGGVENLVLYVRGRSSNTAAVLYVMVEDSAGKKATVNYADDTAVRSPMWAQWKIPLSEFAGVNRARVKKLTIGVGDKAAPKAGGAGRIYLDDIRLVVPASTQ